MFNSSSIIFLDSSRKSFILLWSSTFSHLDFFQITDVFFRSFSLKQAKLFDGVRQDSGDEYEFTDKTIEFYKSKGIDYHSKTIVFSNALDFPKAIKIMKYCIEKGIKCSFGIGTNLTCDVYAPDGTKYESENIVMKMSHCRMNSNQPWYITIKLSDDLGKHMGDNDELYHACYELRIPFKTN